MYFSKEIGESLTFKFSQAAKEMKSQGKEIISLGLGEPDFKTPQYIIDETINAINNGQTGYSMSQGLPELRGNIANRATMDYGVKYDSMEVIVTPGIKASIYMALSSILMPYDEFIIISPYYVSYPHLIKLAEPTAIINIVPLNKDNYSLDINKIEDVINDRTKCIIINSPHNPTGMCLNKLEIESLIDICLKNNIYLLSDEVYEKLTYKNNSFISFASYPNIKDKLILTNGYSKSYAMTGWRIGYTIAPKPIIHKMNLMQQHINTNTCTFVQKGACSIYKHDQTHIDSYIEELELRMNYFHNMINDSHVMKGVMPQGGFFYFADISKTKLTSNDYCVKLLKETGIASTPGVAFGYDWDNYVRFSLSTSMNTIKRACNLIEKFNEQF